MTFKVSHLAIVYFFKRSTRTMEHYARTFDKKFSASDNMFCKAILHQVMRTLYEHLPS